MTMADRARVWTTNLAATALLAVLSACDSGTSIPEPERPTLSNFRYEVEELSADPCPTTDGPPAPSAVIRWSLDYSDANGDLQAPFLMLWQSQFQPRNAPPEVALITVEPAAITAGDGSEGTLSLRQCVKFVEQENIDLWIWVLDAAGNWSDYAYLRIERPEGAPSPPATGPDAEAVPSPDAFGEGHRLHSPGLWTPAVSEPAADPAGF